MDHGDQLMMPAVSVRSGAYYTLSDAVLRLCVGLTDRIDTQ